ncbi:MAG: T9SS type A sorting domain-containing protein, partial [Flavobacteriales bacterium]|nr:T9SS type A sorting domain-containing protein [Flavobacteriales bacterium]
TVTDGTGCSQTFNASIVAPASVVAVLTEIPSCNGQNNGNALSSVGGGCSGLGICPYSYTFTNVATGTSSSGQVDSTLLFTSLATGNYTISVQDQIPCPAVTANITVTEATLLQPTITDPIGTFRTSCTGICDVQLEAWATGSIPFTNPNAPYIYSWSNGATTSSVTGLCGSVTGITYSLTVTDSIGCTQSLNANITEPSPIAFNFTIVEPTPGVCDGSATVSITGGTSPYAFVWNTPPQPVSPSITSLCEGYISASVTDANGCMKTDSVYLGPPLGLANNSFAAKAKIVPNPNFGVFKIVLNSLNDIGDQRVIMYQMSGQLVLEKLLIQEESQINLTHLSKGLYYLQLKSKNGIETKKVIIQ